MKHIIPIDRSTIKRNDRVGSTSTQVPGVTTTTLHMVFQHSDECVASNLCDEIKNDAEAFGLHVLRSGTKDFGERTYEVEIVVTSEIKMLELFPRWGKIIESRGGVPDLSKSFCEWDRPCSLCRHAPILPYSYSHVSIELICGKCLAKFPHTDLSSDSCGDAWSNSICPVCGEWECCEIEFEQITKEMAESVLAKGVVENG